MSTLKVDTIQHSSGISTSSTNDIHAGRAKAWVNLNGKGTISIRNSFNVSSIADEGTGQYTVNFATAFDNSDYCAGGAVKEFSGNNGTSVIFMLGKITTVSDGYSTSKIRASSAAFVNDNFYDSEIVNVYVFDN